ncbi:peptidase [Streptomyces ipomoeae]|jgi:ATP-dependent Clp protease ATP-binding subunit ClpA|uniref:Peptidase n=1 Tax=Streptomyces ipomoeae TaxID=103232 RepID=A0AAE8VX33_9ACTN|nr:Clp protease N-terminal domain-containing protein [Streptomyces ipomoeae]MDX2700176.1 Clp protease N-terminal domain-containing protein [Streptomyces ipomoeae]MDX2828547.1 Clp protease N-terminal domain-containing protein [Streptomyces ipomoeae]MDX2846491.1 Clp protease N-terminal domain-containing protein [Streptomyces ipomoeae]MDX2878767.1 Clp protease N-terminal domain-containing protein [Streptomyces ipomoeae]TQE19202.1 peptidase [Streptomyces ipomoeae]
MFERFTKDARAVVLGAVDHAERAQASKVTEEHLLLALLDRRAGRASFALTSLGLAERRDSVERALAEAQRRAGLSRADADALSDLGIDLSAIVSRVEEAHGVGALASRRGDGAGGGEGGGKKGRGLLSGHRPFTREAKAVLTHSLRAAQAHRDRHIGDEHFLLALTTRPGLPAEVLADHGVTYEALERVLYGAGEAKAG